MSILSDAADRPLQQKGKNSKIMKNNISKVYSIYNVAYRQLSFDTRVLCTFKCADLITDPRRQRPADEIKHAGAFLKERNTMNKAIVTVLGRDRVGIIATVSSRLATLSINILDITQTVMDENIFVMLMLVDMASASFSFHDVSENLKALGQEQNVSIRIQSEEIFDAMHKI